MVFFFPTTVDNFLSGEACRGIRLFTGLCGASKQLKNWFGHDDRQTSGECGENENFFLSTFFIFCSPYMCVCIHILTFYLLNIFKERCTTNQISLVRLSTSLNLHYSKRMLLNIAWKIFSKLSVKSIKVLM